MPEKLTAGQRRYLGLLAGAPAPTVYAWKRTDGEKLVDAFGPPETWTHLRAETRNPTRIATITSSDLDDLHARGLIEAGAVSTAGLAALGPDFRRDDGAGGGRNFRVDACRVLADKARGR